MIKVQKEYLQSAMFGFNDALVSTTGVIVGISTGNQRFNNVRSILSGWLGATFGDHHFPHELFKRCRDCCGLKLPTRTRLCKR